ncbi:MAG TPA: cytochrome c [Gammaproteobacteria bacterium]|nr:cytochrome c [Gammaproteobacteria bacterium]
MQFRRAIVAVAALLLSASASALEAEQAEKAAETRQAVLKVMGWNIAPLGAMARDQVPWDDALFARNAQRIAWMTTMIPDAFRADTRGHELETEALPVIWEDHARFEELAANVRRSAERLAEVAGGGDREAARTAVTAVTDDCKACHERFREERQ